MSLIRDTETRLAGWPDQAVTAGLLLAAGVLVVVALFARPIVKPLVLAWVVAP